MTIVIMDTLESDRDGSTFRLVLRDGRSIGKLYHKHGVYMFQPNHPKQGRPFSRVEFGEMYAVLVNGENQEPSRMQ